MISSNFLQRVVLTLDDGTVYDSNGDSGDVRISFVCNNHISSAANLTHLKLYNLSPQSQQKLFNNRFGATLAVGYTFGDTTLRTLTKGTSGIGVPQREGPNIVTNVAILDGALGTAVSTFSKTFQGSFAVASIVKEVASNIQGIEVSGDNIQTSAKLGPKGMSFSDSCINILDLLKRSWGFGWSIQKTIFHALDDGKSSNNTYKISVAAGNLKSAYPMIENSTQVLTGIQITTVLDGRISPYDKVDLESTVNPSLNGIYSVTSVQHIGDTHPGGNTTIWESVITALFFNDPRIATAQIT